MQLHTQIRNHRYQPLSQFAPPETVAQIREKAAALDNISIHAESHQFAKAARALLRLGKELPEPELRILCAIELASTIWQRRSRASYAKQLLQEEPDLRQINWLDAQAQNLFSQAIQEITDPDTLLSIEYTAESGTAMHAVARAMQERFAALGKLHPNPLDLH